MYTALILVAVVCQLLECAQFTLTTESKDLKKWEWAAMFAVHLIVAAAAVATIVYINQ